MLILPGYLRSDDRDTTKYHLTAKHGVGGTDWVNMSVPFFQPGNSTCPL